MKYTFQRNRREINPRVRWMFLMLIITVIGGIGYNIFTTVEEQARLFIWNWIISGGAIGMGIWLGLAKKCFDDND